MLIANITIGEPLNIVGYIKINGQKVKVAVPLKPLGDPIAITDNLDWPYFYLF